MVKFTHCIFMHFFEIIFSPPKWIFSTAKKYTQTNPLLFSELYSSYNLEGEMTFQLTNFGISTVGTIVNSLIAGNLPNFLKKLSNIFKILFRFCSFFKSVFRNKFNLMSSCVFWIRLSDAFCRCFWKTLPTLT